MSIKLSRREMIAASAAGMAFLRPGLLSADTVAESLKKYGGFRFGIQAHGLRNFPIDEAIRIIHEDLELHWVEFSKKHLAVEATLKEKKRVRALLKKKDIKCMALGVHKFTADKKANRALFEFAKTMGARNISAAPTPDSFDDLDKLVEEYDIRIAIHNHGPDTHYDKISDVTSAVKGRHPHIGACIDTAHFIRSKEDPIKAIYELKGRLFGMHIKDVAEQQKKTKDVIIGKGFLDVEAMFKAMKKVKFPADGAIALEFEGNPDDPVVEIKECLEVAAKAARKV